MDIFEIILLSTIQGVTEFLPISSSGHLILVQNLLSIYKQEVLLNVVLHMGTLVSVIITFRKEIISILKVLITFPSLLNKHGSLKILYIKNEDIHLLFLILIGSIPTAIIGLFFKKFIGTIFQSVYLVGLMLFVTGTILYLTKFISIKNKKNILKMRIFDSLILGTLQGIAVVPGLSRSGITISLGLFLGMKGETASRFSFLLSIPAILGATSLSLCSSELKTNTTLSLIFIGSIISSMVGYISLNFILSTVKYERLHIFSTYCYLIGLIIFVKYLISFI